MILDREDCNVTLEVTNVKEQQSAAEFRPSLRPIIDSSEFKVWPSAAMRLWLDRSMHPLMP